MEVERYSPLELYLMGLIPPDEVPPMHILTNPDFSRAGHITSASVRTITIQDVIAAEGGVRSPDVAESQKAFNLAYVVIQDQPYNDAAHAYFSLLSYALMRLGGPEGNDRLAPFFWATGGRATLNTRLPVDLPEPRGLPGQPIPTSTPGTPSAPAPSLVPTLAPSTAAASAGGSAPGEPPTMVPSPSTPTPLREGLARCGLVPLGLVVIGAAAWGRQPHRANGRRRGM